MNLTEIEDAAQLLVQDLSQDTFIYRFLKAFGKANSQVKRVESGYFNKSKVPGEVLWPKVIFFKPVFDEDLHIAAEQLRKSELPSKHSVRFVVVTDFKTFLARDMKTSETLDIPIVDLPKRALFFLPLQGKEKPKKYSENPADRKAAEQMAKLYDEIQLNNPEISSHELNVFLCRLLFCYFAEDTTIFDENIFTNAVEQCTQADGSDLNMFLDKLFDVLNLQEKDSKRSSYPDYLQRFPWVNGGLFSEKLVAPKFTRHSRSTILECGHLDWKAINPDIFGSMMQAVVHQDLRSETGMHYTSVSNIMKVIGPLFLDDLKKEFEKHKDNSKALLKLRDRLSTIKLFDPACGSGNFLIIAYKEMRKLEMKIFQRLRELDINYQTFFTRPKIQLTQFYGIEIDDFAHEIAILSMWLAEHQMNVLFKEELKIAIPSLPLQPSGKIVCDNATRADWEDVCPKSDDFEIYILGNPPYLGARFQDERQKADMALVLKDIPNLRKLDYIACWFVKGASYVRTGGAELAFVSTNSITQGQLVSILWPYLLKQGVEISFAHRSFQWQNNAKYNAGVTVVIVGLRAPSKALKTIFSSDHDQVVDNITPYLTTGKNIIVQPSSMPISAVPEMVYGNMAIDGGHLLLSPLERNELISKYPVMKRLIKRVYGAEEFIRGIERWCLWISDDDLEEVMQIPEVAHRIEACAKSRLKSSDAGTHKLAKKAHQFREFKTCKTNSLIVPTVSSENRDYIPIGFLTREDIIIAPNQAIYDPEFWVMGILCSKMHNVWVRAVGGRMRTDIRYSNVLCYNTFPLPTLTNSQKEALGNHVINVISERENHSEKTFGELYNPVKTPPSLLQAHRDLDLAVEKIYRPKEFSSDDERLAVLLDLYEKMSRLAATAR